MSKTFEEIKNMLKSKQLLFNAIQTGKCYDINGFRTKEHEDDIEHKLRIVHFHALGKYRLFADDEKEFWDSFSFMVPTGIYSKVLTQKVIDATHGRTLPFQLLVVSDLVAAEKAVKEFLEEEPVVPYLFKVKTLEEINAVPEASWVETQDNNGNCYFCGKPLPQYYDISIKREDCDCPCGQAAGAHNRRAREFN